MKMTISDFDLGWLIGTLDAEGWFRFSEQSRPNNRTVYGWGFAIKSVDKDIIEHVARLLDTKVGGPWLPKSGQPLWQTGLYRREEVMEWCELFLPHMSQHRQEQIQVLLDMDKLKPRRKAIASKHQVR
jgi:hypothetical protein